MVKFPSCVYTFSSGEHAMSQAVILCPLTEQSWVKSHAISCGFCGGQSGTRVDFSQSASVFLINIIPPMLQIHLFIFHLPCMISSWQYSWITHVKKNTLVFALSKARMLLGGLFVGSVGSHPVLCKNVCESHGLTGCVAMLHHILCYLSHYVA